MFLPCKGMTLSKCEGWETLHINLIPGAGLEMACLV